MPIRPEMKDPKCRGAISLFTRRTRTAMSIKELVEFGIAETRFNRLRPEQVAYADHLLSSWRHREFFTGRAITCKGNYHIPVVRHALKVTVARRP